MSGRATTGVGGGVSGDTAAAAAAATGYQPYNVQPDSGPPRGERIRQRYGGGYLPFVQRRRGPAPMASVEDISVKSLEISPPEEVPAQQQQQQQQQQQCQQQCQQQSSAWRRDQDASRFQYPSTYDSSEN